jgi:hypothetical protein
VLNTIIPSQTSTFTNSASVNIVIPQSTTITNIQTNNIQGNNQIPTYIPFLPNTPYSISSGLIQINFLYSTGTNTLYNTSDGSPITIGNTFRFSTLSLTIQAVGSVGFTLFQDPPIIGYIPQRFQYKKTVDSSLLLFNHVHNLKAKCCQ